MDAQKAERRDRARRCLLKFGRELAALPFEELLALEERAQKNERDPGLVDEIVSFEGSKYELQLDIYNNSTNLFREDRIEVSIHLIGSNADDWRWPPRYWFRHDRSGTIRRYEGGWLSFDNIFLAPFVLICAGSVLWCAFQLVECFRG